MMLEVVHGSIGTDAVRNTGPLLKETTTRGPRVRVLLVDDEPSIRKALSAALSLTGYDVVTAGSGEAALAIVRGEHIDVMLLDLRIPDMRGDIIYEVAAATQPHLARQTLFMTGDITDNALDLIAACKCNFLRKPFNLSDMFDGIAAISPRIDVKKDQTA